MINLGARFNQISLWPLKRLDLSLALLPLLCGCATVPEDGRFSLVSDDVLQRTQHKPVWQVGDKTSSEVKSTLDRLLAKNLNEDAVVQIALLNNPSLQAQYAELGIAQSDLVQAGLFANPSLGGLFKFPTNGKGPTDVTVSLTYNFLHLLMRPLKESVAESEYEETRLRMVKATIDLVAQARADFIRAVSSKRLKQISDQTLMAAEASYETAKALRKAGNNTELDLALAEVALEQAKVENDQAAIDLSEAAARLALTLGVEVERLSDNIGSELRLSLFPSLDLIAQAQDKSLDLALAKQRLETLGRQYQVTNLKALIPDLRLGGELERKDGGWEVGPGLELAIPLFDQGQASIARAQFEIKGVQEQYKQTMIKLKTTGAVLDKKLRILSRQVNQMHQRVLPIADKALKEALLQYNAMRMDVRGLLAVKQNQIEAEKKYTQLLRDYWLTEVAAEQLKFGSIPSGGAS